MRCAGCRRDLEIGDQFIEGTAGDFMGQDVEPEIGGLMAEIMGSGNGEKIVYCEDCTQSGGDFLLSTFYGDESPASTEKEA